MPEPNQKFVLAVFEEYHTGLRRYLVSRLRGRPLEAADVAQETYLRLLRMNHVDAVEHLQAYVYRVAANVIRELGLKEQVQASLPQHLGDPSLPGHAPPEPDDATERQMHIRALECAIQRLVEGEVKVEAVETRTAARAPAEIHLTAGQEARGNASGEIVRIETPDLEKRTAWLEQRLVFRGDSLQTVAGEFNRYNATQIVVEAPASATRRITGTFDAHDPDSFAAFLQRDPKLTVSRELGIIRVQLAQP